MMRKQRGRAGSSTKTPLVANGPCAVCGMNDARGLVGVDLAEGERVSLCGSHDLMHRRAGSPAGSLVALRVMFADRRGSDRRGASGEVDELAEALSAAFCRDRRSASRRAS
jgi:hypothetical protein